MLKTESSTHIHTEPITVCLDDIKSQISSSGHDFQSIKRKMNENESSYDFKKTCYLAVDESNSSNDVSNLEPNQPSDADEVFIKNKQKLMRKSFIF